MHNESSTLYNECRFIGMNVVISKLMSLYRSDVVISNELHVGSGTMLTSTTEVMGKKLWRSWRVSMYEVFGRFRGVHRMCAYGWINELVICAELSVIKCRWIFGWTNMRWVSWARDWACSCVCRRVAWVRAHGMICIRCRKAVCCIRALNG